MGETKRISERVAAPFSGCQVDREAGVLRGALICGPSSANERDYLPGAFGDGRRYEGRSIYVDHADARTGRALRDKIGWWAGVSIRPDGMPVGDAHLLKSHPLYAQVMEAAERNPGLMGFSHVARCRTRYEAGREKVESVEEVESVDLVAEPATTRGLFESKRSRPVGLTPQQFAEAIARHPKTSTRQVARAKRLAEDMGGYGMADAPVADAAPADDGDTDGAITAAFESGIMALVRKAMSEGMDKKAVLKKVGKLLEGHADATETPETTETPDEPARESKPPDAAGLIREAIEVCRKVGLRGYDADDLDVICAVPADRREAVARKLVLAAEGAGGERPRSAGRHQTATLKEEQEAVRALVEGKGGKKDEPLKWEW